VFLNPNETYSDSFNLIGFQYLGGTFSFKILPNTNKNYVVAEPYWDKTLEKWVYPEIMLPLKVGEYELYQGQFMSNELTVKFPVHECNK
jgi:hypothetical protein